MINKYFLAKMKIPAYLKKFLYNRYGRTNIPNEYKEVKYIESTGTQYINTEVKTSLNLRIECEYSTTTANKVLFGARTSASEDCLIFGYFNRTTGYYANFGGATSISEGTISNVDGNKHKVVMSNDVFTIDNTSQIIKKGELNNLLDIYLFSWNNNNTADFRKFVGKIYSFKIYNNDILVFDGVPCYRKSDNVAGLYDLVNNTFYTSQGTENFIVGPIK